jgi:hypothetical protein
MPPPGSTRYRHSCKRWNAYGGTLRKAGDASPGLANHVYGAPASLAKFRSTLAGDLKSRLNVRSNASLKRRANSGLQFSGGSWPRPSQVQRRSSRRPDTRTPSCRRERPRGGSAEGSNFISNPQDLESRSFKNRYAFRSPELTWHNRNVSRETFLPKTSANNCAFRLVVQESTLN